MTFYSFHPMIISPKSNLHFEYAFPIYIFKIDRKPESAKTLVLRSVAKDECSRFQVFCSLTPSYKIVPVHPFFSLPSLLR